MLYNALVNRIEGAFYGVLTFSILALAAWGQWRAYRSELCEADVFEQSMIRND